MAIRRFQTIGLAIGADGELPTEFRIFVQGWNDSEKGKYLFDAEAAKDVMDAYQAWGVDVAIDLEHQMLIDGPSVDPTARDARGWCKLEVRNGELWAVGVTWTPDGDARLAQKRQRYVSPAFTSDPKSKRITQIINIAITALPATHNTPALVAASLSGVGMDPKKISEALDALIAGDAEKCMELLKGIIAAAAGGDPDASTEDAPPPVGDGGADETTESAAPPPAATDPAATDEKKVVAAAAARLTRLSGKATLTEAISEIEVWRTSHLEVEKERQKLAAERETLESAERRRLCVELITLGAEFPATVWIDSLAKIPVLKPRWAKLSLAELKSTVAEQRAARASKRGQPSPPRGDASPTTGDEDAAVKTFTVDGKSVSLSARELAICAETKCEPATFAMLKARRTDKETR